MAEGKTITIIQKGKKEECSEPFHIYLEITSQYPPETFVEMISWKVTYSGDSKGVKEYCVKGFAKGTQCYSMGMHAYSQCGDEPSTYTGTAGFPGMTKFEDVMMIVEEGNC